MRNKVKNLSEQFKSKKTCNRLKLLLLASCLIFSILSITACGKNQQSSKKTAAVKQTTGKDTADKETKDNDSKDKDTTSKDNTTDAKKSDQENSNDKKSDNKNTDNNKNKKDSSNSGDVIQITEKMYVTYINDIYTNTNNYLGKTVQLEGMYTSEYYDKTNTTYHYVYRTGPGCCGNDGAMCGFEFSTDEDYPQDNAWISVTGTLDTYEEEGMTYLTLKDCKVTVKDERGAEVVSQ